MVFSTFGGLIIFRISWDERKIEILEVVPEKMGSKPEGSRYGRKVRNII